MSRFLTKILNDKPGEVKPKLDIISNIDQSQTSTKELPKIDHTQTKRIPNVDQIQTISKTSASKAIAPERDFNKRANILEREALPNGLFPGASKAIYDALYLRTLGSINPKRTVQTTRKELMKWSGIKNIKTINAHIKRLKDLGLIKLTNFIGEQTGSHYEIFLPKEDSPDQTQTSQTEARPEAYQKMDPDQYQKTVWAGSRKDVDNKELGAISKTSLKTNTNDDEAFAGFISKFQLAATEIAGKNLSKKDSENLEKLADLLILELKMAARRTSNISSVPAFLTEVLRRKLRDVSTTNKPAKVKIDMVGKPESGSYEIKPLDQKGKEATLEQLREFANDEFLMDFNKWYTNEDWHWLIEQLKTNS